MGFWVSGKVNNLKSSVRYKSKLRMGYMTFRRVLMILCEMFLRHHLSSTRQVALLVIGRVRVDGHGYSL